MRALPPTPPPRAGRGRRGGLRAGAPWEPATGLAPGMDTPHRPPDPDLSGPNRARGDRPRGQAAQLCVAASGRSSGLLGGLPGSRPPLASLLPPTSTAWQPLTSAHVHKPRLSSTCTLASKEGRGRAWRLRDRGGPSPVSLRPQLTSCLSQLCGLEPMPADSASIPSSVQQE